MKKLFIISALVASIAGTTVAQADEQWRGGDNQGDRHGDHRDHDRGNGNQNWQGNRGNGNQNWQGNRGEDRGRSEWRGEARGYPNWKWQGQRFQAPRPYYRPSGYEVRRWNNGDRLPYAYRTRQYYVDYRAYNLYAPPAGYRWVRVDNDVVLAAVATGVIASVVAGLYY